MHAYGALDKKLKSTKKQTKTTYKSNCVLANIIRDVVLVELGGVFAAGSPVLHSRSSDCRHCELTKKNNRNIAFSIFNSNVTDAMLFVASTATGN